MDFWKTYIAKCQYKTLVTYNTYVSLLLLPIQLHWASLIISLSVPWIRYSSAWGILRSLLSGWSPGLTSSHRTSSICHAVVTPKVSNSDIHWALSLKPHTHTTQPYFQHCPVLLCFCAESTLSIYSSICLFSISPHKTFHEKKVADLIVTVVPDIQRDLHKSCWIQSAYLLFGI